MPKSINNIDKPLPFCYNMYTMSIENSSISQLREAAQGSLHEHSKAHEDDLRRDNRRRLLGKFALAGVAGAIALTAWTLGGRAADQVNHENSREVLEQSFPVNPATEQHAQPAIVFQSQKK